MRVIKLYGELGKRFGKIHNFAVNSGAEAIRALCANFPEFRKYLIEAEVNNLAFKVINGNSIIEESDLGNPIESHFKIVPVVIGSSGAFKAILGTALVITGVVMTAYGVPGGNFFIQTGIALTIAGVAQMLSPNAGFGQLAEKEANRPSYLFNGPVNTTQQGMPVPLCYGELTVGSAIVSAAITAEQIMAGYRYVNKPYTVDITALDTEDNYQLLTPPTNFYRKELIESGINVDGHNYWIFRFYYYVEELEAIPV